MDALDLLRRYAEEQSSQRYYSSEDEVPLLGVVPKKWMDAVVDEKSRVERIPYELCVLRALREAIRRREVYVVGGNRWRNPEEDLPADFAANRDVHYDAIRQPLDPASFVADLQQSLHQALSGLNYALDNKIAGGVRITTRGGVPWNSVPKLDKLLEPANLAALKNRSGESLGDSRSARHLERSRLWH